jgi:hypothetical protein
LAAWSAVIATQVGSSSICGVGLEKIGILERVPILLVEVEVEVGVETLFLEPG